VSTAADAIPSEGFMGPHRRLLLAALCAAVLGGCGQEENPRLIPSQDADALRASVSAIGTAIDDGECETAEQGVEDARRQVGELPQGVARSLRTNLTEWLDQIEERIPEDCETQPEETPTPEAEDTPTPEPEQTPTPTPTETPTPTPTETPTPTPTPRRLRTRATARETGTATTATATGTAATATAEPARRTATAAPE
jgi:outer membrane biosynthesis protein TonB